MATSTCPRCGKNSFELKEARKIAGSNYDFYFIQCASCGAVVGTHETHYVSFMLQKIMKKLGIKLNED